MGEGRRAETGKTVVPGWNLLPCSDPVSTAAVSPAASYSCELEMLI